MSYLPVLLALAAAHAAEPLPASSDFDAAFKTAPPNVIFLLDLSEEMGGDCWGAPCIDRARDAIAGVVERTGWARFAAVGTALDAADDGFTPIAAPGSSHEALLDALDAAQPTSTVRNLAESLAALGAEVLSTSEPLDSGYAPICADCQETHVVVMTAGRPLDDYSPMVQTWLGSTGNWDVHCDSAGEWTSGYSSDWGCRYDNVVHYLYNKDLRGDLAGDQRVITHTVSLGRDETWATRYAFANASTLTDSRGQYVEVGYWGGMDSALAQIMESVRGELEAVSAPTLAVDGDRLLYAWYQTEAGAPLAEGHLRAYEIGVNPADPETYARVTYSGPDALDGALWDAGERLSWRPAASGELNEGDRDGDGARDIYTFFPELLRLSGGLDMADDVDDLHRVDFDASLVKSLAYDRELLDLLIPTGGTTLDDPWDMNQDYSVDYRDLQALVDFARGVPEARFRYLPQTRGDWKLGPAPGTSPVILRPRNNTFSADPTYRRFLRLIEASGAPEVGLLAANDGMLHAFDMADGDELWAWIPGSLLYRERGADWAGILADLAQRGQVSLFEGTPTVEDVWIDLDGDGMKRCAALDGCEWRRVALVGMGRGGAAVLALDVTDPTSPSFLWEHANVVDGDASGFGMAPPVVVNLVDATEDGPAVDTWTAIWSGGAALPEGVGERARSLTEPTVSYRAVADDLWADPRDSFFDHVVSGRYDFRGDNHHPYQGTEDVDGDLRDERGAVAGTPAMVDLDADGDVDVGYVAVTDLSGAEPESTLFKMILDPHHPDQPEWCELGAIEGGSGQPDEAHFAVTASWMSDGTLGLYLGTGTPFDGPDQDRGAFIGLVDHAPWSCAEPTPICGDEGRFVLDKGERLTTDPVVYDGVIYFTTWVADASGCGRGEGRIYGLSYDTCDEAMDADNDGYTDPFLVVKDYPSSLVISDQGTLFYATASPDLSRSSAVGEIRNAVDPFNRVRTMLVGEVF